MVKMAIIFLALVVICLGVSAVSLPTPDEERFLDKEYARELINWLSTLQAPVSNNPCKYYGNGISGMMTKRNSELINSLLSLPKGMNDAGK
ncbi:protein PDF [Episyrphus balteatus]|uniref:protein PDF n=1 Tax=Episyrphus balteatus TaxID=286459 RepID=UPI002486BA24|nr:protein PDF [Episyrphus balteatus]